MISLLKALDEVTKVKYGLETNLSSDLMALDIHEALYHFWMITGRLLMMNLLATFLLILYGSN
jgi:tRNA modification GTPase